ncbi:YfhO family protein, partial [Candidatus Gottesmanbacteria bacterium]|nr:YfhO family protein [Candidatus Gottesmanbacteria bacterium]
YTVFINITGLLIFLLCIIFNSNRKEKIRIIKDRVGYGLLSIFLVFAFSAIQLLPTFELWQYSARAGGLDFETVTSYPFPIKHLLSFINPYYFGSPRDGSYPVYSSDWGIFWENTGYIGIVPLILAVLSIIFIKEKKVLAAWIIFISSLLLITGKFSPLYFIFSFPLFNLFRVPSKYLLLTVFSLSLMSGFTLNKIISYRRKIITTALIVLFFISVGTDEYRFSYNYPPLSETVGWLNEPQILKLLPERQSRITSVGSVILWNSVFLKNGWQDMNPFLYFRNFLYPNYNALFSYPTSEINTGGLIPRRSALYQSMIKNIEIDEEKMSASPSAISRSALNLAGVQYLISPYTISEMKVKKLGEISPENGDKILSLAVYQNEEARNQSYISFKSYKVTTKEEMVKKFNSPQLLSDNTILVEDNDMIIARNIKAAGSSKIISRSDSLISLKTSSNANGVLVLSDTNYPGWEAYVDENPTPIKNVNLTQRGILLPQGEHNVVFKYNPKSFEAGKIITVVTFVTTAGALFLARVFYSHKESGTHVL